MTRAPDTGQSTWETNRQTNDRAWNQVLPLMQAGALLMRQTTGYYYVDGIGGLSASRVRKMEREGSLRRVGIDTYALAVTSRQQDGSGG